MNDRPHILLVDDEQANLKALERTLRHEFSLVLVSSGKEALQKLEKEAFAVVLSDQKMPEMSGTELLFQVAKLKPLTSRIILTAHTESTAFLEAINRAEIYRYVTKPWNNEELLSILKQAVERHRLLKENETLVGDLKAANASLEKRVQERTQSLEEANQRLSKLAMTDALTRVLNRRALIERFNDEIERSKRYGHRLSVAMLDVDHFKQFNDIHGHLRGDEALKRITQTLHANIRRADILGRYGGEEFLILMPETALENAEEICERLRNSIEEAEFQGKSETASLTISIGIAIYPSHGTTAEALIEAADQAMYAAKSEGRNRVVCAS